MGAQGFAFGKTVHVNESVNNYCGKRECVLQIYRGIATQERFIALIFGSSFARHVCDMRAHEAREGAMIAMRSHIATLKAIKHPRIATIVDILQHDEANGAYFLYSAAKNYRVLGRTGFTNKVASHKNS